MKPTMIVFMGGQGSGKGTFAHLLMQKQKFKYIEAGEILRQMPTNSTIGQKVLHGELLQDDELFPIISKYITGNTDIILDGFPRTTGQAKWLVKNYANTFDMKIVFLNITEEKMIAHIKNRIKEGGNRADDNDENAVHKRIESFKKTTMPAVDWLKNEPSVKFYDIVLSGDDININFNLVLDAIQ